AAVEGWLLFTITHHPAGGWGEPNTSWLSLSLYALVPLAIAFYSAVLAYRKPLVSRRLSLLLWLSAVGPASLWLALSSYGHAMLLPILLGFMIQIALALISLVPVAHTT